MNPSDLVSAAPWTRVAFTTYALSLSFFEAVILDALLRGGGRNTLILSDPEGVRAGLSEEGARRVGRDYEIEPVACLNRGLFHPKIGVFLQSDDAHLLIGSGNLTFSGWGGNLEQIEHLHPSFAADAFNDTAGFFEQLADSKSLATSAAAACEDLAAALRSVARQGSSNGNVHVLHSLNGPIAEQLALYAEDLGGVTRATVVSPYFDLHGGGLNKLSKELNCSDIFLHAHPAGSVGGQGTNAWPFEAKTEWRAVNVENVFGNDQRPLHAKSIELICRKGRILLAGSANLTNAGLFGDNIEACVLRVQRDSTAYWISSRTISPAKPWIEDVPAEDSENRRLGILSATLENGAINGRVLTPTLSGYASAHLRGPLHTNFIGDVQVGQNGKFEIATAEIEIDTWMNGRLIFRLEKGEKVWEGFVSIALTLELVRRSGSMAPRLIAMLSGTETPDDVATILAWFREDPERLPSSLEVGSGGSEAALPAPAANFVSLHELEAAGMHVPSSSDATENQSETQWRHAMALLRASFAHPRGPWSNESETDDEEENTKARQKRLRKKEKDEKRTLKNFEELLVTMLDPQSNGKHFSMALSLAHFISDRLRPPPPKVRLWLHMILRQVRTLDCPEKEMLVASLLLHHHSSPHGGGSILARRYLIKRGVAPETLKVDPSTVPAFVELLDAEADLEKFLADVISASTMGEQISTYLKAGRGTGPKSGYDSLKLSPYWSRLERALTDPQAFDKLIVLDTAVETCPRCHMNLPTGMLSDLRTKGWASCCSRILLNKDC